MKKLTLIALVFVAVLAVMAIADQKEGHDHETMTKALTTFEGTLVCTGCSLKNMKEPILNASIMGILIA